MVYCKRGKFLMKIDENELTKKVVNKILDARNFKDFYSCQGHGFQTVHTYVFNNGLKIESYAVIKVYFNDQKIGFIRDDNRRKVWKAIRELNNKNTELAYSMM